MGLEHKEYEAYVAGLNPKWLKEENDEFSSLFSTAFEKDQNRLEIVFFDGMMAESLDDYYESGMMVWDNPRYFLKNIDGISENKIRKYEKNKIDMKVDS